MGVEPVIDISKVNEERDREGGGGSSRRNGCWSRGGGGGLIEVAGKREARLVEGKRSEKEIERDG